MALSNCCEERAMPPRAYGKGYQRWRWSCARRRVIARPEAAPIKELAVRVQPHRGPARAEGYDDE